MSAPEAAVLEEMLPERLASSSRELALCLYEALVLSDARCGSTAPAGAWAEQLDAWAQLVMRQMRHISAHLGGFPLYLAKNIAFELDERDRQMWQEFRGDYRAMAVKHGISEMRARQIIDAARRDELARRQGRLALDE